MADVTGGFHIWNKLTDKLISQIYSLIHNILKDVNNFIIENVCCSYHEVIHNVFTVGGI